MISLVQVTSGVSSPVHLTAPEGDPRLFIVEQQGRIRIVQDGILLPTPFLDIRDSVVSGGERGLLSLAFHPQYESNGYFYVNYTGLDNNTRIKRYQVSTDPALADPTSGFLVLTVAQPVYTNHKGGHLLFGPDGKLYIPTGDGGGGGDPDENGQNTATLLGKLLRIDVDQGDPYTIPPDNPFAGSSTARPEIWALGLRNPWRIAFDGPTGLLYVADVGQVSWEEVNVQPAGAAPLNYGWDVMEGRHCFEPPACDMTNLVLPAVEYSHGDGCSITGGFVYRGTALPDLVGHYLYADYCQGWIRSFRYAGGGATDHRSLYPPGSALISSFGLDGTGEIYVTAHEGRVYRISAVP
jgi:glucose/arabinose dehydrogenase